MKLLLLTDGWGVRFVLVVENSVTLVITLGSDLRNDELAPSLPDRLLISDSKIKLNRVPVIKNISFQLLIAQSKWVRNVFIKKII